MTGRVSSGNLTGTCKCNFRCLSLRASPGPPLQKPRHVKVEGAPTWVRFGLITTSGVRFGFLRPSHMESASEPSIRPPWWHSESGTPAGQRHMHSMLLILGIRKRNLASTLGFFFFTWAGASWSLSTAKAEPLRDGQWIASPFSPGLPSQRTVQPMSAHGCARKMYLKPNQCNAFTRFSFWNHIITWRSEITTLRLRTWRRNDNNKGRTIRDLISKSCKQSIYWLMKQWSKQSSNQTSNQSVDQSINQSSNESIIQSVSQSVRNQSIKQWINDSTFKHFQTDAGGTLCIFFSLGSWLIVALRQLRLYGGLVQKSKVDWYHDRMIGLPCLRFSWRGSSLSATTWAWRCEPIPRFGLAKIRCRNTVSSLSTLQLSNTVANDKVQQVWVSEVAILCWATQDFVALDDHSIFWAFDAQALSQGLCKPGEPKRCAASVRKDNDAQVACCSHGSLQRSSQADAFGCGTLRPTLRLRRQSPAHTHTHKW